jgi:hypothetical protein
MRYGEAVSRAALMRRVNSAEPPFVGMHGTHQPAMRARIASSSALALTPRIARASSCGILGARGLAAA